MDIRELRRSHSVRPLLSNYVILLLISSVFDVQMIVDPQATYLSGMVLEKWSLLGLLGYMWLHMTTVHLVGNLLALWVFGLYVCPKLGHRAYVLGYVLAGVAAGMVHMAYDGRPVIGASGAIMGVLGMCVVFCFAQLGRLGPWLILIWFLATIAAAIAGDLPAAYVSHIGGFLSGVVLAFCFIIFGIGDSKQTDPALLVLLGRRSHRVKSYE